MVELFGVILQQFCGVCSLNAIVVGGEVTKEASKLAVIIYAIELCIDKQSDIDVIVCRGCSWSKP